MRLRLEPSPGVNVADSADASGCVVPCRDPTRVVLAPFHALETLELRGCDLSTSVWQGAGAVQARAVADSVAACLVIVHLSRLQAAARAVLWHRCTACSAPTGWPSKCCVVSSGKAGCGRRARELLQSQHSAAPLPCTLFPGRKAPQGTAQSWAAICGAAGHAARAGVRGLAGGAAAPARARGAAGRADRCLPWLTRLTFDAKDGYCLCGGCWLHGDACECGSWFHGRDVVRRACRPR
jgi:hypothetical protein